MKLFIALLLTLPTYAALPSTTVWEVRPTVGSDTTASGCFDSAKAGTDYSQQNAAQYNATDLVLGAGGTSGTSVSHSFVAADVGNCIHITAGTNFTPGYYEITAAAAGVATFDRSAGSAAATGGTYYVGGALATVANANTNSVASNTVWIKATGTYTVTSAMTVTLTSAGSLHIPLSFTGYTTTRGDNGQFSWTTATNSVDLVDFTAANNVTFQNILFSSTAGTKAAGLNALSTGNSLNISVINCKFTGFLNAILGNFTVNWAFAPLYLVNSRITASTGVGVVNSGSTYIIGSMIDNSTGDGADWSGGATASSSSWVVENSIFYKNGGQGLSLPGIGGGSPIAIVNHSDFSTNTGVGLLTGQTLIPSIQISNSIFDANGTYGIASGALNTNLMPWQLYNNAFFNNGTGQVQSVNAGIGAITLTSSPYVSLGGLNFALNSTSGGGAALKGTGFPGVLTNGGGTGYANVGALDPMAGSAGGGAHGFPIVQ
jgi:hypothetical protein